MTPQPGDRIRVRFVGSRKRFIVKEVTSQGIVHAFEDEGKYRGKLRSFMASDVEVVKEAQEPIPGKRQAG